MLHVRQRGMALHAFERATDTGTAGDTPTYPPRQHSRVWRSTAVAAALLLLAPRILGDSVVPAMVIAGAWAIAAVGLNTLAGRAGLVSLGQGGLVAVGAYATAYASATWGWAAEPSLLFGVAAGLVVALLTAPICRLQGFYLATATLAMALIVQRLLVAQQNITGGANGFGGIQRLSLLGVAITTEWQFYVLVWGVAIGAVVLNENLLRSRFGRALDAIHADEATAAAAGIAVARHKQAAWLISAAHCALAGGLYAYYNLFLTPDQFPLSASIDLIAAVVVGGAGTMLGPIVGIIVIDVGPAQLQIGAAWSSLVAPGLLVCFASFFPRGLLPQLESLLRRMWARRGGGR